MKLIEFEEQTVVIAKDQPEYEPLPAHVFGDEEGRLVCCWRLSWWERIRLLWSGVIWHQVLTFGRALQPQLLTVEKPEMVVAGVPAHGVVSAFRDVEGWVLFGADGEVMEEWPKGWLGKVDGAFLRAQGVEVGV